MKQKKKKLSTLLKHADDAFSIYIRTKYASNGYVSCVSCGKTALIAEMDCGHFVGRQHKALRFSEDNCHPQCRYCNRFREGEKDTYALYLVRKYGPDILQKLQDVKHRIVHFTPTELMEIRNTFRNKLKELI